MVLYLNDDWKPQDGGQLRVYPTGTGAAGDPGVTIPPHANRLVVFWSDRVPHEVLPAHGPRFAMTVWWLGLRTASS